MANKKPIKKTTGSNGNRLNASEKLRHRLVKRLCCIMYFFVIIMLVGIPIDLTSHAQLAKNDKSKMDELEISMTLNPDSVSPSGKSTLLLSLTNIGKSNAYVNSIELSESWNITKIINSINIPPNRTVLESIELQVPESISSGDYNLVTKISTTTRDYTVLTSITVTRIESLPLSENIPLSILVLIFSGVITYSLASYIMTGTYKRNYVEIGLWSAGLGFLNWGVLYMLREVIKITTSLELIQYDFYALVAIMSVGFTIGISSGMVYKYLIIPSLKILREKNIIKQKERSLLAEGLWSTEMDDPLLPYFISDNWKTVRENLGINYGVTIKVYLKNPVNSKSMLTGCLYVHGYEKSPDMLLQPKFTIRANMGEVNDAMNEEEVVTIIMTNLRKFRTYKNKVTRLLKTLDIEEDSEEYLPNRIVSEMKNCTKTRNFERYLKIVYAIDFSRYTSALLALLNKPVTIEGDGPIYVQGENVLSVEIVQYEHAFGIHLIDFDNEVIPRVYDKSQLPMATAQEDLMIKDYLRRQSNQSN